MSTRVHGTDDCRRRFSAKHKHSFQQYMPRTGSTPRRSPEGHDIGLQKRRAIPKHDIASVPNLNQQETVVCQVLYVQAARLGHAINSSAGSLEEGDGGLALVGGGVSVELGHDLLGRGNGELGGGVVFAGVVDREVGEHLRAREMVSISPPRCLKSDRFSKRGPRLLVSPTSKSITFHQGRLNLPTRLLSLSEYCACVEENRPNLYSASQGQVEAPARG